MLDPDREISGGGGGGGGGHPDPEIREGGPVSQKIFFGPSGLKNLKDCKSRERGSYLLVRWISQEI